MSDNHPSIIAIDHDDYHAQHVGRTEDGRQFFLTTPFESASESSKGCEYVALYLFSNDGKFLEAEIESFGARDTMDKDAVEEYYNGRLKSLGQVEFGRVEVSPFMIEKFGTKFGLVPREPEDEEDILTVVLLPGDYMAFFEPWDSGEYDT